MLNLVSRQRLHAISLTRSKAKHLSSGLDSVTNLETNWAARA